MTDKLNAAINSVADHYGADVLAYIGFLTEPDDDNIIVLCRNRRQKRKNVLLILSTPVGSADAAYRIARCLQRAYKIKAEDPSDRGEFFLYVHDICKSAGTLLSLGATKLIMSQGAQLGPIDVQLLKEEEVGERRSGLAPRQALETMSMEAGRAFNRLFRYLRFDARMQLSTKMAAELAAKMTIGVMEPIYAQLDPIRLGEVERFVRISQEYGERLRSRNVKKGTIEKLLGAYPSHEFVIDRDEARDLFDSVEAPTDALESIADAYIAMHLPTADNMDSFINYLNEDAISEDQNALSSQAAKRTGAARTRSGGRQIRPEFAGNSGSEKTGRRHLEENEKGIPQRAAE